MRKVYNVFFCLNIFVRTNIIEVYEILKEGYYERQNK